MDLQRKQQLIAIVDASHEMLRLAQEGEWHRVAESEAARRTQVELFFITPVSADESSEVASVIREVLRLNEQVAELGVRERERIGNEQRTCNRGEHARRAYRRCVAGS